RSTKHLIELAETFEELKVNFISIRDNIDTSTAMGRFFFRTMASIAELERDIISERTKAGLQSARSRGRKGGRPIKDPMLVERALKLHASKEYSIKEISDMTGVSKSVLYRAIERI
ncbi:recombinase family protein, partial [Fictibacillus sp. 23RED33]|uniref:recombinase family protein n=1 Tax=Fictibacillus sp. 23RED33 TaxID=2745879 RepID=UPI0018CE3AFF